MWRKLAIILISLNLCWTTLACSSPHSNQYQNQNLNRPIVNQAAHSRLPDGKYPVQQATYDDGTGDYSLLLLNTPAGTSSDFRTDNLQMARLTDAEIAAGEKTYLQINNSQPVMHLTEDFKIAYVHTVTQTQTNPQTGQPQTVVVRRENSFWAPFAGALAGQALGSLLFTPRYYVPPVYQSGIPLTGFGGHGTSYSQAVEQYQTRYKSPPPATINRTKLRTTGRITSPSSSAPLRNESKVPPDSSRATGKGYGGSTLQPSGKSAPSRVNSPSSFGSGGRSKSGSRSSFGSGRRR